MNEHPRPEWITPESWAYLAQWGALRYRHPGETDRKYKQRVWGLLVNMV